MNRPQDIDGWTPCTIDEDVDLTLPAFAGTILLVLAIVNAPAIWALVRGML